MPVMRHLSWENFCSTVLVSGQQRVHRVIGKPLIELFGDGTAHRIGILIEMPSGSAVPAALSGLTFIDARSINQGGLLLLELSTDAAGLFHQFYHFAIAVAERVVVDRMPPPDAVDLELKCFADLLAEKAAPGIEWQIGLTGELLFLERLVAKLGIRAVSSWIGQIGDPHDFRLESREFEVKTTVSPQRLHVINGAAQLLPSAGCSLSLVSVLLGPPGAAAGFSLPELVNRLHKLFSSDAKHKMTFERAVHASGYRAEDSARYTRRFVQRRALGIARVDDSFPAITRQTIQGALGPRAPRVERIEYEVNIEGLELEDGTPGFESAILS